MGDIDIPERMKVPLALIHSNDGKIDGKTRLQKMVFLAQEEEGLENFYKFEKYNYGPYSFDLSDDLNVLKSLGLISITKESFETEGMFDGKVFHYRLTERGREKISEIRSEIIENVQTISQKWNSSERSLESLIDYVYDNYMD